MHKIFFSFILFTIFRIFFYFSYDSPTSYGDGKFIFRKFILNKRFAVICLMNVFHLFSVFFALFSVLCWIINELFMFYWSENCGESCLIDFGRNFCWLSVFGRVFNWFCGIFSKIKSEILTEKVIFDLFFLFKDILKVFFMSYAQTRSLGVVKHIKSFFPL